MQHKRSSSALVIFAAIALSLALALPAFAVDSNEIARLTERADETLKEVERTAAAYKEATARASEARASADEARARLADLEEQIEKSQSTIERISGQLDGQKQRSSEAMRLQYLMEAEGFNLTEVVLSSSTLNEFLENLRYLNHFQEFNAAEINKYTTMKTEYEDALAVQKFAKIEADNQKAKAEAEEAVALEQEARAIEALAAAQDAREKAQQEADEAIEARVGELEAAGASGSDVDWRLSREEFVEEWAGRIDAYFEGSPMEGCGKACAEAAWDFGVDPRWSPAVATVESGKGRAVPYNTSNNAWGWFANATDYRIFSSFEEGCRAHVEYLGKYYGYTVTLDHARVYCPPNADSWFSIVSSEMQRI